jgi:hypothetical protein
LTAGAAKAEADGDEGAGEISLVGRSAFCLSVFVHFKPIKRFYIYQK